MKVSGWYFNGIQSKKFAARLLADKDGVVAVQLPDDLDQALPSPTPIRDMVVSSRLEEVPRSLRFPGGEQFLTDDNDAIDHILKFSGLELVQTISHRLESWIPAVVISWFGIVVLGFSLVHWGIPAIAENAVRFVPQVAEASMGEDVLKELESRGILTQSQQPASVRAHVNEYLSPFNEEGTTILIRRSDFFGANAFALPGGKVVLTDALINVADNDQELLAVYLHELGHLHHRHIVKQALQNSMVTLLIVTVTRDLTAATDLAAVIPTMLLSFSYSRKFETEADQYALERMRAAGVNGQHFANVVKRLMTETEQDEKGWLATKYMSTHPAAEDRLVMIEAYGGLTSRK